MSTEVYIIAPIKEDDSLPTEFEVEDERFFISDEEAVNALNEDFPPSMRNKYAVYTVSFDIKHKLGEEPTPDSELADVISETVETEKSWEENFLAAFSDKQPDSASDYYFCVNEDDEMFVFVPVEYWDKLGKLMPLDNVVANSVLPSGFEPDEKGWCSYSGDLSQGKFALSTVGFIETNLEK